MGAFGSVALLAALSEHDIHAIVWLMLGVALVALVSYSARTNHGGLEQALSANQIEGRVQDRIRGSVERTIAALPAELEAEWADEWRAELDVVMTMPLIAAQFSRGLRRSAQELTADLAVQSADAFSGVRSSRDWRTRPLATAIAAARALRVPATSVLSGLVEQSLRESRAVAVAAASVAVGSVVLAAVAGVPLLAAVLAGVAGAVTSIATVAVLRNRR